MRTKHIQNWNYSVDPCNIKTLPPPTHTHQTTLPRSKLVPRSAMAGAIKDGAGFAGFAASFDLSPADGDMIAVPDMSSLIVLPWKKEVAWVAYVSIEVVRVVLGSRLGGVRLYRSSKSSIRKSLGWRTSL